VGDLQNQAHAGSTVFWGHSGACTSRRLGTDAFILGRRISGDKCALGIDRDANRKSHGANELRTTIETEARRDRHAQFDLWRALARASAENVNRAGLRFLELRLPLCSVAGSSFIR
jgi:hypothetical protein